jgi:hypothetical protein
MERSLVYSTGSLIVQALYLLAAVATLGIGALLLSGAVKDASDLASSLPTRLATEDTSEAREANRRKALQETIWLLAIRTAPGGMLLVSGICLLVWIYWKLLGMAV